MPGTARQPAHGTYYQKRPRSRISQKYWDQHLMIFWPMKKRRAGQMLRIADWRGKVCSLIFFCISIFWWPVRVWVWMFFLIQMTCVPWSSFSCFFFILMMCVNPWCWAGPVRRSWIIYQKFIFTIPRLSFSTYISTFSFFQKSNSCQHHDLDFNNAVLLISTMLRMSK